MSDAPAVVLDTNVLVAAGFHRDSASHEILHRVRDGRLRMVWNERTRDETERILRKIPPLSWDDVVDLYREVGRHDTTLTADDYDFVEGALDRVFLALAESSGAALVSSDRHLLDHRGRAAVPVVTPGEFLRRLEAS